MFFSSKRENESRRREEKINSQIEDLREQGLVFHYDRQTRLDRKYNRHQTSKGPSRRVFVFTGAVILIICAFLVNYQRILNHEKNRKGRLIKNNSFKSESVIVDPKIFFADKGVGLECRIFAAKEGVSIAGGTVLQFTLYDEKGDLEVNKIVFDKGEVLYTDKLKPLFRICTFSRKNFDQAKGVKLSSPELGLEGDLKLR